MRGRKNTVLSKSFSEKLATSLRAYHNRAIMPVQVLEELISLTRDIRKAQGRGETLGLTEDEVSF